MVRTSGRPANGGRTNLPAELTPFMGREWELSELSRLVHGTRLISLLGPAGIGKTRLALRLAALLGRRYPDGSWLVQLAPVTNGDLLPAVIAGTLGITEARPDETLAVLDATLSSREMLLVLDNCEHVVERAAGVIEHLLLNCPALTIVVTSRERLGVLGELAWRVPPLDLPRAGRAYTPDELEQVEAVALFADRARRASPHFSVTEANCRDVGDLVCRLDGLPLAVELAAGWMETLSPGELARELDHRYQILVARGPVMSERHTSLWAAIDSSYERLDPAARDLFTQLGVFAGGWDDRGPHPLPPAQHPAPVRPGPPGAVRPARDAGTAPGRPRGLGRRERVGQPDAAGGTALAGGAGRGAGQRARRVRAGGRVVRGAEASPGGRARPLLALPGPAQRGPASSPGRPGQRGHGLADRRGGPELALPAVLGPG
ncbi:MAG: hypothetical protein E6J41_13640 [Chloroflexi bacterium]|nr:MAG: hypothetical protein E6J41_13640 [Chloroflexota bacterium]